MLTTLSAVKTYLKLGNESTDDELLSELIKACSTAIENHCQRKFETGTYEEEYDGSGKPFLLLQNYPITSISSVEVDEQVIEPGEYKVRKNNGMLFRSGVWPQGIMNIRVTYTAGLSEVPPDVELACKVFVKSFFNTDVANFSTTFGEGFVFRADSIPAQVKMLLQPYKKVM